MASEKVVKLIDEVKNLTVLELSELVKELEEEFGVSAAAPVAVAVAGGGAVEAVEEQSEFDVILDAPGDKKMDVLKVVRAETGLGLKEVKELVDGAPSTIKEGLDKASAEALKAKIEEAGGKVTLK